MRTFPFRSNISIRFLLRHKNFIEPFERSDMITNEKLIAAGHKRGKKEGELVRTVPAGKFQSTMREGVELFD